MGEEVRREKQMNEERRGELLIVRFFVRLREPAGIRRW